MTGLLMLALLGFAAAQYGGEVYTTVYVVNGVVILQGHRLIFRDGRDGKLRLTGPLLEINEQGEFTIEAGSFATTESGQRIQFDGGRLTAYCLPSTDKQAINNALALSDTTLDQFLQQIGPIPPQKGVFEVLSGFAIVNGLNYDVDVGVAVVFAMEFQPSGPGVVQPSVEPAVGQTQTMRATAAAQSQGEVYTTVYTINGLLILQGQRIIFHDENDGELRLTGPLLDFNEQGDFTIEAGSFATTESGQRVQFDGGRFTAICLPSTDKQAINNALARTDTTLDQFLQQIGTIPSQKGVFEVLSGVFIVNGFNYNVDAGVAVVFAKEFQLPVPGVVQPTVDQTQTISVTESYQTTTVVEPVVLSKYSTRDVFVTVTAPLYNNVDVTSTNFVKQTVYVTEEQVIRSQAAGNIVVNTIAVPSQTAIIVRDTSTNFLLRTIVADVVSTLQHVATNFVFSTATINVPVTSSITQTITRTDVTTVTAFVTATVGSTIFTTQTVVITQAPATQTQRGY